MVLLLVLPSCASAQRERQRDFREDGAYEELIHHLEMGMVALEELGREEALAMLARIADEARDERRAAQKARAGREREGARTERQEAQRQLEILALAHDAFRESNKQEAAERIELAMHAHELRLAGHRGEEAQHIYEQAPRREELGKLLKHASGLWAEWGHAEQAGLTAELAQVYARRTEGGREREAQREREGGQNQERELATRMVKGFRLAEKACREADRPDAGDLCKHAYRALEMQLEGRRDEEARQYIQKAPELGAKVELMHWASQLWAEWGHEEEAAFTGELAATLKEHWQRRQERREREVTGDLEALGRRIEILRFARDAFAEMGDEKNAGFLNRAIHYGELVVSGANEEKIAQAVQKLPSKGNLIEGLQWAAHQYGEWGNRERARACGQLAEYYAQHLREERGEGEESREAEDRELQVIQGIEHLEARIEILRWARGALAEAGRKEKAGVMERFIHVAELQQGGASDVEIGRAFEGLSMETTIDLLELATELYADWDLGLRARGCAALAHYYAEREGGREGEHEEQAERAREEDLHRLKQRVQELQEELQKIKRVLHEHLERR